MTEENFEAEDIDVSTAIESDEEEVTLSSLLTNKQYNWLKWVVTIALPAFTTFYLAVGDPLSLPDPAKVVGVLAALTTLLGVLIGVSTKSFNAAAQGPVVGIINVSTDPNTGAKTYSLEFPGDPETIDENTRVTFQVNAA